MDASTSKSILVAVGVISGLELFVTLVSILKKTSRPGGALRWCAVVPFGIYGGIAIQAAFKRRYDERGEVSKQGAVWLGQALHGVVVSPSPVQDEARQLMCNGQGIALAAWGLVSGIVFQRSKKGHWPYTFKWEDGRRSSAGFYLAVVDACFFVCVAIAVGCGSSFTPWHFNQCDSYGIYNSWPITDAGRAGECQRMLTIQIVAVLALQVECLPLIVACQIILTLPLLAPPAPIRAQLFFIARALRFRRRTHKRDAAWRDLEKAALHDALRDDKASLVAMFREDAIATSLANHLHFDDIANVSRTSRTMRGAVFRPSPGHAEQRFDMICESACMDGAEKSECWACARVVCDSRAQQARPPPDRGPPRALLRPLHKMLHRPARRAPGALLRDLEPARPVRPAQRVLGRSCADGGAGARVPVVRAARRRGRCARAGGQGRGEHAAGAEQEGEV
ncbi:Uncharacterized protein TPAR_03513 [Tolypocladium paradoxum]|uniref:Uncharacterized protein n=1 Tax=Tolypocladium paradoxum TaxID=94208 RepID=A0A2S4L1G4_9HYPO|nr:Uncharacterized protein TPAR_03513 [Tolypocladium paradoxum]